MSVLKIKKEMPLHTSRNINESKRIVNYMVEPLTEKEVKQNNGITRFRKRLSKISMSISKI